MSDEKFAKSANILKPNKTSLAKRDSSNPAWKGDKVGYAGIHDYVRSRKYKPELCECCGKTAPIDLANKSGEYKRDLNDWEYLCRKCHMDKDGRNAKLRSSGKSRKLPDVECVNCGRLFHRNSGMQTAKFCSRECYFTRKSILAVQISNTKALLEEGEK